MDDISHCIIINILKEAERMPRIKIKEQDSSYTGPDPQVYRRYSQNTKTKLWKLVSQAGMKTSSAAKLLKVKNSTAKMIMKKFKNGEQERQQNWECNLENQGIQIKKEQKEQDKTGSLDLAGKNQSNKDCVWVYFPVVFFELPKRPFD